MIVSRRKQPSPVYQEPSMARMLETGLVKRCGVCWRIWEAEAITVEEGQTGTPERCPTCVDGRTPPWKARTLAEETAYAASREPGPQMSIAPLKSTFPGTIRVIEDSSGNRVYDSRPISLVKTVAKALILKGRSFSSSDTITGDSGLTITVSSRTSTETDLSVTAGGSMASGTYSLTFNNVIFRNIFSVR